MPGRRGSASVRNGCSSSILLTFCRSWGDVLEALLSHDTAPSSPIRSFLSHPTPKARLSQLYPTFPQPSSQSRSAFETQTAAINVTASASTQYDIEQIKGDATWLSTEVQIDEIEALRLTVLEWQSRPESRLKSGFSDAELASLRDGLGIEYVEAVDLVPGGGFSRDDTSFDSEDSRRTRLLQTFFSEKAQLSGFAYASLAHLRLQHERKTGGSHAVVSDWQVILPEPPRQSPSDAVHGACDAITASVECLGGRSWAVDEVHQARLNDDSATSILKSVASTLRTLLLEIEDSTIVVAAGVILEWLQLMAPTEHFASFSSDLPVQQSVIGVIRSTASIITLALLGPQQALQTLVEESPETLTANVPEKFFLDKDNVADINNMLLTAAGSASIYASLGVLAWALILVEIRDQANTAKESRESKQTQRAIERGVNDSTGRRSSTSSIGSYSQSVFEDILAEVTAASFVDDPVDSLLHAAVRSANVFDYVAQLCLQSSNESTIVSTYGLRLMQELLRTARPIVGYEADLLDAQLALLSCPIKHSPSSYSIVFDPRKNFIEDPFLMETFFDAALQRFPYEALPFLRICKSLAQAPVFDEDGTQYVTFRLRRLDTYTQAAVNGFTAYRTIREDENANLVELDSSVGLLNCRPSNMITAEPTSASEEIVPAQTVGEVISESTPPVIQWRHSYSGLAMLGKWLEMFSLGQLETALSDFEPPEEVATIVISLLTSVLRNTHSQAELTKSGPEARKLCLMVLSEATTLLSRDGTVVSCVSEILEQQLQLSHRRAGHANDLLAGCVDFFTVLCRISPSQTWSILARSSLFSTKGGRRSVVSIIASTEAQSQNFLLLESYCHLFNSSIDLMLKLTVEDDDPSKIETLSMKQRRGDISQRVNAAAVRSFTESMLEVFNVMQRWTFADGQQKYRIIRGLSDGLSKIVVYTFGTGDSIASTTRLTASYESAADCILRTFLTGVSNAGAATVLTRALMNLFMDCESYDVLRQPLTGAAESILKLATIVLRCSKAIGDVATSTLGLQFVDVLPITVRLSQSLPAAAQACYTSLLTVLESSTNPSVPSILGHLGSVTCVSFLECVRHTMQFSSSPTLQPTIWKLLSQLVTIDQQWLAIVLITGSPPDRERKQDEASKLQTRGKPMLEVALDHLTNISHRDPVNAAAMLDFVAEAQQNWPTVIDTIATHQDFFPALVRYVTAKDMYNANDLEQALHNTVAAGVTDLAIIHLHRLMVMKDEKVFSTFIPLLTWLTEDALDVAAYNTSLQSNLRKNFSMKYKGLNAMMFKRTAVVSTMYGDGYFYDLDFADQILCTDTYWNTPKSGFREEFRRANINMSVVDSELALLRSFQHLCLQHSHFFARHADVAKIMARIASKCLHANTRTCPPETLFDDLFQMRMDMAVMVVRPLVASGAKGSEFTTLLSYAWDAARFRSGAFEMAIANSDLVYWRSVLSVVLLSLQFHVQKTPPSKSSNKGITIEKIDTSIAMYCEIASIVIGDGLRSVVGALLKQRDRATTQTTPDGSVELRDVALLLHLLQAILRLPTLPQFEAQLSDVLIASGVGQSALLLYSWSHLILEGGQPLYADLATRVLASISSLPKVAEDLAVEGVLNRLLTSRTTQSLQSMPNGAANLDTRSNGSILYSLWSQGMLPICLNLLHSLGGGVAGEVSGFLNRFPLQLNRASLTFSLNPTASTDSGQGLTLEAAVEASTLSLISRILESFKEAGPAAGIDPTAVEPLTGYDEHKKALAEDVRDALALDQAVRKKRTIPQSQKETTWQNTNVDSDDGSKGSLLDQKIVRELKQALQCLNQYGDE